MFLIHVFPGNNFEQLDNDTLIPILTVSKTHNFDNSQYLAAIVCDDLVRQVMQQHFDKVVSRVKRLKGYDNLNFHVKVDNIDRTDHYLLKFGPCTDPENAADFFHEQISLMKKLSDDLPELIQGWVFGKSCHFCRFYHICFILRLEPPF